jgi:hypothetical protein
VSLLTYMERGASLAGVAGVCLGGTLPAQKVLVNFPSVRASRYRLKQVWYLGHSTMADHDA